MAHLRERRPAARTTPPEDDHPKSKQRRNETPDLEPSLSVVLTLIAFLSLLTGSLFYYKLDNRERGPFSTYINTHYPLLDRFLNKPSIPLFGAAAAETPTGGDLQLTEEELKAYDGTDPDKPIYLGINGTIFDVSASPAFYGPGGHYHHFVGKDATRAWITECWDEDEQFTWRLDGVEAMFLPKWMDESLETIAAGQEAEDLDLGGMPLDMLAGMAKKSVERFGSVTDKEKAKRRVSDKEEAEAKVQETLAHWVGFFSGNAKYTVAGSVVRDESRPSPPKPCKAAMEKRPIKGGKLEGVMQGAMGNLMGGKGGAGAGTGGKGEMPAFVKEKLAKEKEKKEKGEEVVVPVEEEEDEEDLVHDEL
ncbi:hypothetical protein M409DRAFT_64262 [Zasmidium cellare ATCC 36951]|uniref:Cytochrome b5 heme-binding domain-containing protein n=1 Tax=Zasmidium cellare ATCC 36951 TaxID=1080233 RepID=A0A6A6CYX3_ZASCE|nr:uncharacterized protein M409DRAFT_64262 [Zasmidium cellare ATCC 36951]KAF2170576.1 hypothetical protein M409DRAFT_64262 [Zasmidium cellare ATCC 36951]